MIGERHTSEVHQNHSSINTCHDDCTDDEDGENDSDWDLMQLSSDIGSLEEVGRGIETVSHRKG